VPVHRNNRDGEAEGEHRPTTAIVASLVRGGRDGGGEGHGGRNGEAWLRTWSMTTGRRPRRWSRDGDSLKTRRVALSCVAERAGCAGQRGADGREPVLPGMAEGGSSPGVGSCDGARVDHLLHENEGGAAR
jgi:hypothetical protein